MAAPLRRMLPAAVAIATAAGILDDVALLQAGAVVDHMAATEECACLRWKDVYSEHGVECGAGQELLGLGGPQSKKYTGAQFCTHFYEKLSNNFCMQMHFQGDRPEQWCYVSAQCTDLNNGTQLAGKDVSWKVCRPDKDILLRSMTPEGLHKMAVTEDKDAGLVFKMAYPVYQGGLKWPDAKDYLVSGRTDGKGKFYSNILRAIQAAEEPMIFDSRDHHPPFGVVIGRKVYESHFNASLVQEIVKGKLDLLAMPGVAGKVNEHTCLAGC